MKNASTPVQQEVISQYCKQLRVPTMAAQFRRFAETAASQQQTHLDYLEALLAAEMEEREQNTVLRRRKDAHLSFGCLSERIGKLGKCSRLALVGY